MSLSIGANDINSSISQVTNNFNQGGLPGTPVNSVQINVAGVFGGFANLLYKDGTGSAQGLLVGKDVKIYLNANGGATDQYLVYNSANDYTELYVDGAVRAQF